MYGESCAAVYGESCAAVYRESCVAVYGESAVQALPQGWDFSHTGTHTCVAGCLIMCPADALGPVLHISE